MEKRSLKACFETLEDPRVERTQKHKLIDIVIIAITATIGQARGWREIRRFAEAKEAWFRSFLELPNGLPSRVTFARVISALDPKELEKRFEEWTSQIRDYLKPDHIVLDGKKANRSHDRSKDVAPLHMVSAFSTNHQVVLANEVVGPGKGELSALCPLLQVLFLKNCLVSIDAMGTRKNVADQILSQDGDYLLALKSNNRNLWERVKNRFEKWQETKDFEGFPYQYTEDIGKDHGRLETRKVWQISIHKKWKEACAEWPGLKSIAVVESTREINGVISTERRYYLCSLDLDVKRVARAIRKHWSIENQLHHVLDVTWQEDQSRVRLLNARENLAIFRRWTLNLLKRDTSYPGGPKVKSQRAMWNDAYMLKIISH